MGLSINRRMDNQTIAEIIAEINPEALLADGFEAALVGYTTSFLPGGSRNTVAVYDRDKCIDILVSRDHMTFEDAEEFFSFNTDGAYAGENGPVFVEFPHFSH